MPTEISVVVATNETTVPNDLSLVLDSIERQSLPPERIQTFLVGPGRVGDQAKRVDRHIPTEPGYQGAILNRALEQVGTDWLALTDATTVLDVDKLARQMQVMRAEPEAEVCVHPVAGAGPEDLPARWDTYGPLVTMFLSQPWAPGAMLMHCRALGKLDRFREIPGAEWELAIRMTLAGRNFVVINEPLARSIRSSDRPPSGLSPITGDPPFIKEHMDDLGAKDLFRHTTLRNVSDGYAFKAGLYNSHDFVDESFALIGRANLIGHSAAADYWKGLLLRRQAQYRDSLAAFGEAIAMPFFGEIYTRAVQILAPAGDPGEAEPFYRQLTAAGTWDPSAFVGWCEQLQTQNGSPEALAKAEHLQQIEGQLLLLATYEAAVTETGTT